jgi:hypothetical protein
MTDLLDLAVQAHGGMERWRQLSSIRVAASITGAIWFVKGQGDALKAVSQMGGFSAVVAAKLSPNWDMPRE